MKKSSNLFVAFILTISLFSGLFAQSDSVSKLDVSDEAKTELVAEEKKKVSLENIEQDVAEVLTMIQDKHFSGKQLDYNALFKNSIDTMLHTLDPHSNYFDAKEFEEFRTSQESQYFGIGATIGDLRDKKGKVVATFIKATFDGAPANRAGLRFGDKIVEVNGVSMLGKPYSTVRDYLRGPRGTVAKIVIERFGTKEREDVEIIRDAVSQPSISEAYIVSPGVGYIAMTGGFNRTTYDEFRVAMRNLKLQGMKRVILDLRNNGGGLVREAFYISNTFLETGQTIFTQKGRQRNSAREFKAENPDPDKTPIVIMINGNSASASEILAGALQDNDRALIVGENTFGKGLVQNPYMLEYGTMLLLTIAKYETPSGRLIQRDYSDGNLYDYYQHKIGLTNEQKRSYLKKTISGRDVFGGDGILPDTVVKTQTITRFQAKLIDPIFIFSRKLVSGNVTGLEKYRIMGQIDFGHRLGIDEFPITKEVFQAFRDYMNNETKLNLTNQQIDNEAKFISERIRYNLVSARYGNITAQQVLTEQDPQVLKAVQELPIAKQLAHTSKKYMNN